MGEKAAAAASPSKDAGGGGVTAAEAAGDSNSNSVSASAAPSEEGDDDEKEFSPTIDMMINDFDDERTMEEEEALEGESGEAAGEEARKLVANAFD